MNREIKFRVWDKPSKKILYPQEVWIRDNGFDSITRKEGICFSKTNNLNGILMQYTSLKDKNGKEIYEGDIVRWVDKYRMYETEGISEIVWRDTGFDIKDSRMGYEGELLIDWDDLEVIGNIYENPELLK